MTFTEFLNLIATFVLAGAAGFACYMLNKVYALLLSIQEEATRVAQELAKYKNEP